MLKNNNNRSSSKQSKRKKSHWWSWPWFFSKWSKILLAIFVLILIIINIFIIHAYSTFSKMIDRKISGEIFQNTSQLYAAPLTIFPGQTMRPWHITAYLKKAGYMEKSKGSNRMGEYSYTKQGLKIIPHEDSFYGSNAQPIRIEFDEKTIISITALAKNTPLESYELEPHLITNLFDKTREKRRLVSYAEIPRVLRDAVIATEDRRFFEHSGFDPIGLLRALLVAAEKGRRPEATSTLTQQLVRNFWLSPEKKLTRKFKEIFMSIILENRLTKEEIFTLYANDVYLGQRGSFSINGFGEAATAFFNKDIKSLTLPEAAFLAGIIQSPNHYNPHKYTERATQRRNVVLRSMLETGKITEDQYRKATKTLLNVAPISMDVSDAPYFVDLVKERLLEKYSESDLLNQQYKIFTTLDPDLQRIAYQAIKDGMREVDNVMIKRRLSKIKVKKGQPPPEIKLDPKEQVQACLIAIDPHTGEVRAFVGGRDYGASQLDRVVVAKRQPGSIFKPFVFATALNSALDSSQQIITASTIVDDSATSFQFDNKTYEPNNYGEKFNGPVTMRKSLTKSINIATVKFAEMVGFDKVVNLAKAAGLNSKLMPTPAVALGAYEVTPFEMAGAYTIFANSGKHVDPIFIKSVRDESGKTIEKHESKYKDVLDPKVAYLMTSLMEGVINHGTGARARSMGFTQPAAGKTGTSHDGWFAGYTSDLLCIVWVGFDDNRELHLEGANSALPIWTYFMKKATDLRPWLANKPFIPPLEGITTVQIDADTGLLATTECQNVISENYLTNSEPKDYCGAAAHEWLNNLRNSAAAVPGNSNSLPAPPVVNPGKSEPLVPPKQPSNNILKRFFSKIF